jgi:hypothetical protein
LTSFITQHRAEHNIHNKSDNKTNKANNGIDDKVIVVMMYSWTSNKYDRGIDDHEHPAYKGWRICVIDRVGY